MKSLNETTNSSSTQSLRDILIFSKPHSKKLLDNMYYYKRPLSSNTKFDNHEKSNENPISILDYDFLNPRETNSDTIKKSNSHVNIIDSNNSNFNSYSNNIYLPYTKKNPSKIKFTNDNIEEIKEYNNKQKTNFKFNVYEKEMALKIKKEIRLEQLRQEKIKNELSKMKKKPTINKTSIKMSKNNIPIYKRLNQINEHFQENLNKIREEMDFEREIKDMESYRLNEKYTKQDFQNWINRNNQWEKQRKIRLEQLKDEIEEFEADDELKFKPEINKKSEKIVRNRGEDFTQRIYNSNNNKNNFIQNQLKQSQPTFTPQINKNYKIRDKYYDFMNTNQFEMYNQLYKNNK